MKNQESNFLGKTLLTNKKTEIDSNTVFDKDIVIALYFSANWGIGCKQFTPILSDYYNKWNAKTKKIEVIFVSRDQDEENFNEYIKEMPWVAIPFKDSQLRFAIKSKYNVKGVPSLIIIDKQGNKLSDDAREEIEVQGEKAIYIFQDLY